jgi:hypothetical protein
MTVPEAVIGKINTYLGSVGQPRHISPRGQPIATGCREWLLPPGSEGATDFVARDQELRVKLQRLLEDSELTTELEQLATHSKTNWKTLFRRSKRFTRLALNRSYMACA